MKKIISIIVVALAFTAVASAQPRAIGARIGCGIGAHTGYSVDFSYEHTLGGANFLEANLGISDSKFLDIHASYNFVFASPNWTASGEWNAYVGPSIGLTGYSNGVNFDAGAVVGLEYTFHFPLMLSFDVRPEVVIGDGGGFVCHPSLGIRYRF